MESGVKYLLVGVFVLVLTAALVAGVLWFSVGGFYQAVERYLVYADESVAGLSQDAPVTYMGVDVGRVASIGIVPDDPDRVRLLLEVEPQTPIRTDTQAILRMQGLTGLLSIDLIGTSEGAPALRAEPGQPFPVIEMKPSLMSHLEENVSELLYELKHTASALNALLSEENRDRFGRTLAHIERVTGTLAANGGEIETALDDLAATLENSRRATDELPQVMVRIKGTAEAFARMADRFSGAAADIEQQVEASGRDVRRFTRDTLPQTSALVDELHQAARNMRQASEMLKRDPSILIYGAPEPEPGPGE